jgi:lysyl-tRNA synthetase class 2
MQQLWQPSATIDVLILRARIIQKIRDFFLQKKYLEVDTPSLGCHGVTDIYLSNLEVNTAGETYFLQTSPEYHMKRLLAAGSGPIFQIGKAFREEESGRLHNIEFTMLEWYVPGFDHHDLMQQIEQLLQLILEIKHVTKITYEDLFVKYCNINPHTAELDDLQLACDKFNLSGILDTDEQDKDQYLFLLLTQVIEPKLKTISTPVFVYDFPASQASLAKIEEGLAKRFEVYYQGVELANGFYELTDYDEQRKRFEQEILERNKKNLSNRTLDVKFLNALKHGLPECSGVALGLDRLIMLALEKSSIQEVISFIN